MHKKSSTPKPSTTIHHKERITRQHKGSLSDSELSPFANHSPKRRSTSFCIPNFQSQSSVSSPGSESDQSTRTHSRASLQKCPCGSTTGGKSWILKCINCKQNWHSTCANLKGDFPKASIDSLTSWHCPWCFTVPFAPPKNHKSQKTTATLQSTVISNMVSQTSRTQ